MVLVATVAVNASNFLYYSLAARSLDVAGYGALMSLVSLILIVTAPAMVAQNTLAKLVADLVAAGDPTVVARLARKIFNYSVTVAGVLFTLTMILSSPLAHLLHISDPLLIPLAALAAGAMQVVPLQRGIFQGANRFAELSSSILLEAVTRIVTIVPLARFAGARGGLAALCLSMLLPLIVFRIHTRRIWPRSSQGQTIDMRRFSRAAIETGAGFLAVTTMLYFDIILVRHYFDAYHSGLYSATTIVGRAIFAGAAFIPMLLIPKIVARRASREAVRRVVLLGVAVTAAVAGAGILFVAIAPQRVVTLFSGAAYAPATPYVLPYAVAVSALAGANVAAAVRVGLHRFGHVVPLVIVALGEIVVVAMRHATIADVLWTIVGGHTAALIVLVFFALRERPSASEPAFSLAASLRKS